MGNRIFDIIGSLIVLGTISTLVLNANGTATVFGSLSNGFSNALKTAQGR